MKIDKNARTPPVFGKRTGIFLKKPRLDGVFELHDFNLPRHQRRILDRVAFRHAALARLDLEDVRVHAL